MSNWPKSKNGTRVYIGPRDWGPPERIRRRAIVPREKCPWCSSSFVFAGRPTRVDVKPCYEMTGSWVPGHNDNAIRVVSVRKRTRRVEYIHYYYYCYYRRTMFSAFASKQLSSCHDSRTGTRGARCGDGCGDGCGGGCGCGSVLPAVGRREIVLAARTPRRAAGGEPTCGAVRCRSVVHPRATRSRSAREWKPPTPVTPLHVVTARRCRRAFAAGTYTLARRQRAGRGPYPVSRSRRQNPAHAPNKLQFHAKIDREKPGETNSVVTVSGQFECLKPNGL